MLFQDLERLVHHIALGHATHVQVHLWHGQFHRVAGGIQLHVVVSAARLHALDHVHVGHLLLPPRPAPHIDQRPYGHIKRAVRDLRDVLGILQHVPQIGAYLHCLAFAGG